MQIFIQERISRLWSHAEVIKINPGAGKVMGTRKGPKLSKSLYQETISRLCSDAEVIEINRGAGTVMGIGEEAKLNTSFPKVNLKASTNLLRSNWRWCYYGHW